MKFNDIVDALEHPLEFDEVLGFEFLRPEFLEARDIAVHALIKQFPIPPTPSGHLGIYHECPNCSLDVSIVDFYCRKCGQKLLWE